jgi:uncharacterized cupin superfamily protein
MPRIDLDTIAQTNATGYPAPFDEKVAGRLYRRLAPASGLTQMGASHVVLKPGAWSSQRHWHEGEDELVVMLAGEGVLIDDDGEQVVRPGDILAFPAGERNGHHIVNRSDADCVFVAISAGDGASDRGEYPDIDMTFDHRGYFRRDGTPYDKQRTPR